jgi:DNA-binding transcriptional MocR family regulator
VLESLKLRALEVRTDPQEGICLDSLERTLGRERVAACVLVPSYGNLLGHCMPEDRRARLADILQAVGIPLVEDDVQGELCHGAKRPKAIKAFDRRGTVLLCSSFSKTLAPGLRVGWAVPGRYLGAVERHKYAASVSSVALTETAVASYLADGGFDRHLRRLRGRCRHLQGRLASAVGEHFPEGTRMARPLGGHMAWVELPEGVDSLSLHQQARLRGINFAPGAPFSVSGEYGNCIRLNYAIPWSDAVDDALRTLGTLVEQMQVSRRAQPLARVSAPGSG